MAANKVKQVHSAAVTAEQSSPETHTQVQSQLQSDAEDNSATNKQGGEHDAPSPTNSNVSPSEDAIVFHYDSQGNVIIPSDTQTPNTQQQWPPSGAPNTQPQ
jgi:hypothetical protein